MDWKKAARVFVWMVACSLCAFSGVTLDDIAVGATYHMTLTTGDELEGVVDSKTDTSLILDCKGNAYTFTPALIADYKLLALPPQKGGSQAADLEPLPLILTEFLETFDESTHVAANATQRRGRNKWGKIEQNFWHHQPR